MDTTKITISTLSGLSICVLVMSVLFAVTTGSMSALTYALIGAGIGLFAGLSIYGLLNKID